MKKGRMFLRLVIAILASVGAVTVVGATWVCIAPTQTPTIRADASRALPLLAGFERSWEERYLALLKKYLVRYDFGPSLQPVNTQASIFRRLVGKFLASRDLVLARNVADPFSAREEGRDWPKSAETMIGLKRLDNLEVSIRDVLAKRVPGDLIECGAWRGGATIFMRAALEAFGDKDRAVWVADSFEGLPKPNEEAFPADKGDMLWSFSELAVSLDEVKANFARYGLLDDRVRFIKGWFKDTLPGAPVQKLAILRVDADMYESTWQALTYLYPKLSVGGYCIIDDYGAFSACARAVEDFRKAHNIASELKRIDWTGVYWQRTE
jgi:O-methyltransferase